MADHKHVFVSKRLVAINSASSVMARIVNFVVLLWVYQYLLRHLPAEEFAVLPLVTSLMVFGPLFFSFFVGGIARYMVDAYARGDGEEVRRISSSLFPVLLGFAAILMPALILFALNIGRVFNVAPHMVEQTRLMFILLAAGFVFHMVTMPFTTAYVVRQRFVERNLLEVARDILRAILTVTALLYFGPAVIWVVVATVTAEFITDLVKIRRSFTILPELGVKRHLFSFSLTKELLGFGLWTTLGQLGTVLYTHAATLILNLYGTAVDVTAYHVGATFFRQIESTVKIAAMPLQPAVTAMNALNDRERLARTVFRGGRYALWASMIIAVPLVVYADIFVELYMGPNYDRAPLIIILFMINFVFTQPSLMLGTTAMATKRVREFFLPAFLFQFAGFMLMVVFAEVLSFGAVGVTLALTIVTVLSQVLYFWGLFLRLTGKGFPEFARSTLLRGLGPALVAAAFWLLIRQLSPPATWSGLILQGALGSLVYLSVILGLCLDEGEKADFKSLLAKRSPALRKS
ncbi:hypothetical protein KUV47_18275 [Vannielia litorea]|uniref:lipopolysaccharide biosynthesis protein n=1 Tax=Vannielia litorea TaxID=1217970 RepID=UPI001C951409|nr:hypothetical protein [Vannielia litorea]MBY6155175.1 hypothetical protein [Vannielia litorea]